MVRSLRRFVSGRGLRVGLFVAALVAAPGTARPAEITAFVSGASPGQTWNAGYGGMFTISLFNIVHGDIEGAYQGSALPGTRLLTLHAKAYVGPTFGRLVPYAGLGAGVYVEGLPADNDRGTLGSVFVGVKLKFPMGLVLRAEYQWLDLPQPVPVEVNRRYFVAAGLSF